MYLLFSSSFEAFHGVDSFPEDLKWGFHCHRQLQHTYTYTCLESSAVRLNNVVQPIFCTEAYRCLIMLHYKYNVAIKYIAL